MVLAYIFIALFIGYSGLIIYYWMAWRSVPVYEPVPRTCSTTISIIIPACNEEENIGKLLNALKSQTYPASLTQIIVVDDHSTDKTAAIAKQFGNVQVIQLTDDAINSYKKKAIEKGIAAATGEWIITTDADCIPGADWLQTMVSFKEEKQAVFIAAPVMFTNTNSLLQIFQALDFLVLQGITAAAVYKRIHAMCNGANLGYERKAFYEVNGFAGIDDIASGDDMLLMHKISKKEPSHIHYLKSKEAIVSTEPMLTWKSFLNQRIRWASKARNYDDKGIFFVLLGVYLFNLFFLVLLIAGCWNSCYWWYALGGWVGKTMVELPFVNAVAGFYKKQSLIKYFFFFQPLHILYTIFSGLLGQMGKYEWKGRRVK